MTRIDLIPDELPDKMLVNSSREIIRTLKLAKAFHLRNEDRNNIPDSYSLGTGSVKFFYDKGNFIYNLLIGVSEALFKRNLPNRASYSIDLANSVKHEWPKELYFNWEPSKIDIQRWRRRVFARIVEMEDEPVWSEVCQPIWAIPAIKAWNEKPKYK